MVSLFFLGHSDKDKVVRVVAIGIGEYASRRNIAIFNQRFDQLRKTFFSALPGGQGIDKDFGLGSIPANRESLGCPESKTDGGRAGRIVEYGLDLGEGARTRRTFSGLALGFGYHSKNEDLESRSLY